MTDPTPDPTARLGRVGAQSPTADFPDFSLHVPTACWRSALVCGLNVATAVGGVLLSQCCHYY